ncbi:MAG: hypothetical protein JXQ82_07595 [Methanomicrobiaceae archaeon]|nr:hypothetical protein [Methanomicrobiaceae archaeon]
MADTYTDNLGLTKISRRKGWQEAYNGNMETLGKMFCVDNDGNMWFVHNAIYDPDTDTWSQTNTAIASTATKMAVDGSFSFLMCAAGNSAITWVDAIPAPLLSEQVIDADKDWNQKSITNLNQMSANFMKAVTGDTSRKVYNNAVSTTSLTYVLVRSIPVPLDYVPAVFDNDKNKSSTFKVSFNLYSSGGGYSCGKIYVNGVAKSAEYYTATLTAPGTTYTVDIPGVHGGDTIELWMQNHTKSNSSDAAVNTYFEIFSSDSVVLGVIGSNASPTW